MSELPNFPVNVVEFVNPPSATEQAEFKHSQIRLIDYAKAQAKGLVLYFYPKDNTAGCTTQAQEFSQYQQQLSQLGYAVIGVSRDKPASHEKFITAKDINFPLISDTDERLCQYFDIIAEKKLYGKVSLGIVRTTLVFNSSGKLIYEMRNVRAKGHVQQLMAILPTL